MSAPDDDLDPTGMRDLLRSLPDPGPMPDDLVARIQASLAELSLDDVERVDGAALAASGAVSRGTSSTGRASWFARNGSKLAVAAVVLVGGGALIGSLPGLLAGSSDDSASSSAAGGSAESGGDAAREAPLKSDTDSLEQGYAVGPVVVTMSGRTYTAGGLAGQLDARATSAPLKPLTAESPGIGPIGTEIGVRSCLEALGVPADARAEVDLALVDGAPAAIVVMTREGGRTAYAVGRNCTVGNPSIITGPIQLP